MKHRSLAPKLRADAGNHLCHVAGLHSAQRCGARTRKRTACAAPAVKGRKRCRMYGGARGSGAPLGNQNALRSGHYTANSIELRKQVTLLIRESRKIIEEM